jgi:hydrogenase maturation protease
MTSPRVLVAGVGNLFMGDDAFGIEVVKRLMERSFPTGVQVIDFGTRGVDLAYTILEDYDLVILVDAASRGGAPGTLYVLEPEVEHGETGTPLLDAHSLVPEEVLGLVRALGGKPGKIRIVACEPGFIPSADELEMGLSTAVTLAIEPAVTMVEELVREAHA